MSASYPKPRGLSGMYLRVERDGWWTDVCFEDMTEAEQQEHFARGDADWSQTLAMAMAEALRGLGDQLDLVRGELLDDDA